jgi:hypothetical protein
VPHAPALTAPAQVAATAEPFTPTRPINESKIVIQRSSGGDIMVINPDGTGLHRLASGIDPVLSPDGQTAAFTHWEGESGYLWLIGMDGSKVKMGQGAPACAGSYPPIPTGDCGWSTWPMAALRMWMEGLMPSARPDTRRIVSGGGRGLLAADLNQDNRQNLTDEINDGSPVFSPNGRYMVVTADKEGNGAGYNL